MYSLLRVSLYQGGLVLIFVFHIVWSWTCIVYYRCLETGVQGAVHNVETNLSDLKNETLKIKLLEQGRSQAEMATRSRDKILQIIEDRKWRKMSTLPLQGLKGCYGCYANIKQNKLKGWAMHAWRRTNYNFWYNNAAVWLKYKDLFLNWY